METAASLRDQGIALHRAGRLPEAEQLYRCCLERDPRDIDARHMLGLLSLQQGRAAEALELIAAALAAAPGQPDIRTHHALALHELGRLAEALADFDQVLAQAPGHGMAVFYRGALLQSMGRFADALASYDSILARAPDNAETWFRRGNTLWQMGQFASAAESFEKALAFHPRHFGAMFNLGTVRMRLGDYAQAFAAYLKARDWAPDHPELLDATAGALLGLCDLDRWDDFRGQVVTAVRDGKATIAPLTFLLFSDDAALRRACSVRYAARTVPAPLPPLWTGKWHEHDRIRIAYLSADFRQHATAELMAGLFERHDRTRFEITAVSFGYDDASPMRMRVMQGFDHFLDVRDKSDAEVARMLFDHGIDIAVDLKVHTDHSRPAILAHRPCPVQVNYLGYPGTIGAPWLDYILADAVTLPFSQQPFYSEKIVHLPHCYQVNDSSRPVAERSPTRAEAGLPDKGFVFCCFNAAWKMNPAMFGIWMRLLTAVPGSVLWLLADNDAATANLRACARERGVDPARLVFAPRVPSADHLARHRLADLFLDTLPYNAHTTASDALWAGLPILTILGAQFDGRVAASLLTAIGLPELITTSLHDYESLALALARDPARLAALRARLAVNRSTAPLFDTDLFRRHIEAAYEMMLDIARRGEPPRNCTIPA